MSGNVAKELRSRYGFRQLPIYLSMYRTTVSCRWLGFQRANRGEQVRQEDRL